MIPAVVQCRALSAGDSSDDLHESTINAGTPPAGDCRTAAARLQRRHDKSERCGSVGCLTGDCPEVIPWHRSALNIGTASTDWVVLVCHMNIFGSHGGSKLFSAHLATPGD